ncbi:hypothetical protein ACOXVJ_20155 [Pseudomonas knackmussii]|uniref:hypothetical protein n=1 Tax=Pseudomonas knackmussii TaxID=65741 RepID=UPI0012ECB3AF|nr:hypothetical protein [Pseudomonas knackmussii]
MTAFWAPIRVEPIAMSGEAITVAVAIIGEPGTRPHIISALSEDVVTSVFGPHAPSLIGIARTASDSLFQHLEKTNDFKSWIPPISGVSLGDIEEGQGNSIEEIARQALRASACLSAMTEEFRSQEKKSEKNRLVSSVKRAMKILEPAFADRFHVPVPVVIRQTKMSIYCDYYSSKLAINMCSMGPGRNLPAQFDSFYSRLCKLDQLRGNEALIQHNQAPYILIEVPDEATIEASPDKSNIHNLEQKILMAQDLTEKRKFNLTIISSPNKGAQRIVELERAA